MSIRPQTITIASGGTASDWYRCEEGVTHRTFSGVLTSGDTIRVEVSNDDRPNDTLVTKVASQEYSTTSFGDTVIGEWSWLRVVKTGSNGAATINVNI
jgi:hypothetical protein